jgi:hypothetical protein
MKDLNKLLEAYVTIVVGRFDVNPCLLFKMEMFIKKKCVVGFLALERGRTLSHHHMQMVVKLHISSLKMLNKILKEWLGGMIQRKHQMGMLCIASSYKTFIHLLVWLATIRKILMNIIFNLCIIMLVGK